MPDVFGFSGNILTFIGVLLVLVIGHELGHFVTAKLSGMTVQEFGIGYPPRLFGVRFRGTDYTVNLLPLGGFVKILGEEDPTERGSFASKPALPRIIVLAAGSTMNALMPVLFLTIAAMLPHNVAVQPLTITQVAANSPAQAGGVQPGDQIVKVNERTVRGLSELDYTLQLNAGSRADFTLRTASGTDRIVSLPVDLPPSLVDAGIGLGGPVGILAVAADSPAERAGIKVGDQIVQVGETPVRTTGDVQRATQAAGANEVVFTLKRDGQDVQVKVTPRRDPPPGQGATGIQIGLASSQVITESLGPLDALGTGVRRTFDILTLFRNSIYSLFAPHAQDMGPAVTGPIGIAVATSEVAKAGFVRLLEWASFLSMNLAIMNILPIPMLDGGRILFVLIEVARRGRRVPPEREALVHTIGFAVLMTFVVIVSFNDIRMLLSGGNLIR